MLTLLTLAFASTHVWAPRTVQVGDTLNGIAVTTSEQEGWIVRTAAGSRYGYDDGMLEGGPSRSMGRARPTMAPSAPPVREMAEALVGTDGGPPGLAPVQQGPLKAGTAPMGTRFPARGSRSAARGATSGPARPTATARRPSTPRCSGRKRGS